MKRMAPAVSVLLLLAFCLSSCSASGSPYALEIRFLDVGQGDCTLLRTQKGDVLVDTGPESEQELLLSRLRALGISSLELMIITHPDEDHMGGADGILRSIPVKEIWTNGQEETHETAMMFRQELGNSKAHLKAVKAGEKYTLGEMTLFVLAPFSTEDVKSGNEGSIVLRLTCGKTSAIFSGDAEMKTEEKLLSAYGSTNLRCDLYKVGHHGSSTSTGEDFLYALSPKYAVIFCGRENSFGHPHGKVLERLERVGAEILRTDLNGEICFVTNGEDIALHSVTRPDKAIGLDERRKQVWQIF